MQTKEYRRNYYKKNKKKIREAQKLYHKKSYQRRKVKILAAGKKWKKDNPEKVKEIRRRQFKKNPKVAQEWLIKRTIEVMNYLGNKCEMCGFDKKECLQIHHKEGKKEYSRDWAKKSYDLDKLSLLCANCHCLIHYKNRYGL